jgi:uncharacterized membrane protein YhaH (DUF805 family)
MSAKDLLFSAKGRIGRKDFWIVSLLLGLASIPVRLLGVFGDLLVLIFLFPHVCLFAKRCHDLGKSGWLAAWLYVPPGLFGLAVGLFGNPDGEPPLAVAAVGAVVVIGAVVFYFRIGLAKGDPAPNAYGRSQLPGPRRGAKAAEGAG